MELTNDEKKELMHSKELFELYRSFATTQKAAFNDIHLAIAGADGVAGKIAEIKAQTEYLKLPDINSCDKGCHWDPALGECVPD